MAVHYEVIYLVFSREIPNIEAGDLSNVTLPGLLFYFFQPIANSTHVFKIYRFLLVFIT